MISVILRRLWTGNWLAVISYPSGEDGYRLTVYRTNPDRTQLIRSIEFFPPREVL